MTTQPEAISSPALAALMEAVDAEYREWDMVHVELCDRGDDVPAELMKLIHECRNGWPARRSAVEAAASDLIAETRAAMPCYDRWSAADVEPCPSCEARGTDVQERRVDG